MDNLTSKQRHKNMANIKSKNTRIELILCKALYQRGYRYRKNYNKLPGRPDIVITKYRLAIFCDSEFFHGKNWITRQTQIKSNRDYWIPKISRNIERDNAISKQLNAMGWSVLRFWGDDITKHTAECIQAIEEKIFDDLITSQDIYLFVSFTVDVNLKKWMLV